VHKKDEIAFDIRKILGDAQEEVKKTVQKKMIDFCSAGKCSISNHSKNEETHTLKTDEIGEE